MCIWEISVEFEGAVAVITGAASGIGRSTALALAKLGTDIVVADIDDMRMGEVRHEIEDLGRRVLAVHCDVSQDPDVKNLAAQTVSTFGRVDLLMNNAGVMVEADFKISGDSDTGDVMGPDEVAQIIVKAIKEKNFLILTHPSSRDRLLERGQDLLSL
jgi:NAD(P)-dependent dehydrogenase (short-subunit alcohol dehydrogenase family)